MDQYGRVAQRQGSRWLPRTVATLEDPEAFFTGLGLEVGEEIRTRADELAGDDPGGEGYLEKVGRLQMARFTAEETILRERVLLAPEDPVEGPEEDRRRRSRRPTTRRRSRRGGPGRLDTDDRRPGAPGVGGGAGAQQYLTED